MTEDRQLVNKEYLLEKYPGKGGWTFAAIPEVLQDKHSHFGWVRVNGSIDGFEIKNYHLMPMGNGTLFMPVRAEIRKKIGKKEGDWVRIVLYEDSGITDIPDEFLLCLQSDEVAFNRFHDLSESEKKEHLDWIYSAKKEDTRVDRIAKTLNKLTGLS